MAEELSNLSCDWDIHADEVEETVWCYLNYDSDDWDIHADDVVIPPPSPASPATPPARSPSPLLPAQPQRSPTSPFENPEQARRRAELFARDSSGDSSAGSSGYGTFTIDDHVRALYIKRKVADDGVSTSPLDI